MNEKKLDKEIEMLEAYWDEIPVGKENAIGYDELQLMWGQSERECRKILHNLSILDNGDDYILIRSAKKGGGFYKTMNADDIKAYRKECLAKGRSNFAPVKKINRVIKRNNEQISMDNNLRVYRENANFTQAEVCSRMKEVEASFDVPLLSKMENGVCLPTYIQCKWLAEIYGCNVSDLVSFDLFG